MPPPNTPIPTVQQNGHARKRTAPVVPAIPLALSKPRPVKPQPKPESDVKGGAELVTPVGTPADTAIVVDEAKTVEGGNEEGVLEAQGSSVAEATNNGAYEPAAPAAPNGVGDEAMVGETSRPATASSTGDATATNSPELARKPTERFDMRQIRTELPPAFVPSAEQHTPRSNASSQSTRPPTMSTHAHISHPSTSSIVFGGHDSSSSSPAPPQSAGSAYNPPSFPSFGGASAPPFNPSGHAHHTSEPHGPRMFHPGFQPPAQQWHSRPGFGQAPPPGPPHHSHAHMPFRYPPREAFTPVDSPRANGKLSRSASQASSAAADQPRSAHALQSPLGLDSNQEPRTAFPPPPHNRQFHHQMQPPPPPQMQPPDVASQMDNAETLRQHILSQFANSNSADCNITFVEGLGGAQQSFSGHRIILGRSPKLLELLSNAPSSASSGTLEVELSLGGGRVKLAMLNEALKYVYGGSLLQLDHHRPSSSAGERAVANIERMETALSYVATGLWLKMPVIAARGLEVAGSVLHWDTIPTALTFALEGGLSQAWTVDDGSEDPFSAASSDDSLGRSEITGSPSYDPYSTALLQRIVDFTIHVFPPNFYLDSTAPQLESCPRLPSLPQLTGHESRPSISDPRLSQIRFGEIPVGPSFTTTTISSILLSLPFQVLKAVLEHFILAARLGPETAASIMRQVVAERERRRTKAQQARTAGKVSSSTDPQLLQNLYWEELVEISPQHKVGFRLARRRKGIDTPLSSGPE